MDLLTNDFIQYHGNTPPHAISCHSYSLPRFLLTAAHLMSKRSSMPASAAAEEMTSPASKALAACVVSSDEVISRGSTSLRANALYRRWIAGFGTLDGSCLNETVTVFGKEEYSKLLSVISIKSNVKSGSSQFNVLF
jgi:hypothetical protein